MYKTHSKGLSNVLVNWYNLLFVAACVKLKNKFTLILLPTLDFS